MLAALNATAPPLHNETAAAPAIAVTAAQKQTRRELPSWQRSAWERFESARLVLLGARSKRADADEKDSFFRNSLAPILASSACFLLFMLAVHGSKRLLGTPLPATGEGGLVGRLCLPCLTERQEPVYMSILPSRLVAACCPDRTASADEPLLGADGEALAEGSDRAARERMRRAAHEESLKFWQTALHFSFCVVGVMTCHIALGFFQERTMTRTFESGKTFEYGAFLTLCNRFATVLITVAALMLTPRSDICGAAPVHECAAPPSSPPSTHPAGRPPANPLAFLISASPSRAAVMACVPVSFSQPLSARSTPPPQTPPCSDRYLIFLPIPRACALPPPHPPHASGHAHPSPPRRYSIGAYTNLISSMAQYLSLDYVSFPLLVLSKSCKMPPVMLLGYLVHNKSYRGFEYTSAMLVLMGTFFFLLYDEDKQQKSEDDGQTSSFGGVCLLLIYIFSDAFTSNWQSSMFEKYGLTIGPMMLWSSIFALVFGIAGSFATLEVFGALDFMRENPSILQDIVVISIFSALGQFFVLFTIQHYGALSFAAIANVRQVLSALISIIYFQHVLNSLQTLGMMLVFLALAAHLRFKWYARDMRRARKKAAEAAAASGAAGVAAAPPGPR